MTCPPHNFEYIKEEDRPRISQALKDKMTQKEILNVLEGHIAVCTKCGAISDAFARGNLHLHPNTLAIAGHIIKALM
jgi:hypothetical protein